MEPVGSSRRYECSECLKEYETKSDALECCEFFKVSVVYVCGCGRKYSDYNRNGCPSCRALWDEYTKIMTDNKSIHGINP